MTIKQYFNMPSKDEYSNNQQQIVSEQLKLSIRRAEPGDVDELSAMSRICYSYLLRWQGPRFHNRKRWMVLMDTESCEVWVCLNNDKLIGFFTLILDRQEYDRRENKPVPGLVVRLYTFGVVPKLFLSVIFKSIKRLFSKIHLHFFGASPGDNNMSVSNNLIEFEKRQVPWVGYIAVTPAMQGRGVATEMIRFCAQRAHELGHKEIWAKVEKKNMGAMEITKKAGFVMTEEINHIMFAKHLLKTD